MACAHHVRPLVLPEGYSIGKDPCAVERYLSCSRPTMMYPELVQPALLQLSPVSFLPSELLIRIFQHGVEAVPNSARALPLAVAVAAVCKSWRAVVLHAPELWTHVSVTSATPIDHLQTCLERSGNLDIHASFCHWVVSQKGDFETPCTDSRPIAILASIMGALCRHAQRLRTLALWDVSDTVVCAVMKSTLNYHTPRLTSVSIRANQTTYTHYYRLRDLYLLPFLSGGAPSLTHVDIDHFPIETFRVRSGWPFDVQNLTSLVLRTQECPGSMGEYHLPSYLIEFPALCALLRSTSNLSQLALYGPVVEPDEESFPWRPPAVMLPSLETLIVHCRDPGVRYQCELLNALDAPNLSRLEIPWHDDLSVELPDVDRTTDYLYVMDGNGGRRPRFGSVKMLYVHDSAVERQIPAQSFVEAFPSVEEVVLGGTDVASFAETLGWGCVLRPHTSSNGHGIEPDINSDRRDSESEDVLNDDGDECAGFTAWRTVKKITLKEPEMEQWQGWVTALGKWLRVGHRQRAEGQQLPNVEIRDVVFNRASREKDDTDVEVGPDDRDSAEKRAAFEEGLDELRQYAQVVVV